MVKLFCWPVLPALLCQLFSTVLLNLLNMEYPLLATKLFVPPPRPNRVVRPRLLEKLDLGIQSGCRLFLVSAPAGFGKTTLASEWVQRSGMPVVWLAFDEGDRDPIRMWFYLVAALQTLDPNIGKTVQPALHAPQPPPIETLVSLLINDLSAYAQHFILVLEDYHLVDIPKIHELINFFIDHLPPNVHLLILTRADPPLHLARRRGRAQLCEIRAADLRFTREEVAQFFDQTVQLPLTAQDLMALEDRTEGWIAGLQMAAVALANPQQMDSREFIADFTGNDRYIADYLLEEVLLRQPEPIRNFLLQTSILQRLSASLCDAVLGRQDSQTLLTQLEAGNLFVVPMDNQRIWYRYHHLFAQLLRQYLAQSTPAEEVRGLYQRAGEWHFEHGYEAEAVEYILMGGDDQRAAEMMEKLLKIFFGRSELITLTHWAEVLPMAVLATHPTLCVGLAWAANATSHVALCEKLIRIMEDWAGLTVAKFITMSVEEQHALPEDTLGAMVELTPLRARLTLDQGDLGAIISRYSGILPYLTHERDNLPFIFNYPSVLRPPMVFMIAMAEELTGNISQAEKDFAEAAQTAQESGNVHIIALGLGHLGQVQATQGKLKEAEATFSQAVQIAEGEEGQKSAFFGISYVGLGNLAYERNQLDAAQADFRKGIQLGELWKSWETLMPGYIGLARLHLANGDADGAFAALEGLSEMSRMLPALVQPLVETMSVEIWQREGELEKVRNWIVRAGYSLDEPLTLLNFEHMLVIVRFLLATGDANKARELLASWIQRAVDSNRWLVWVRLMTLMSMALDQLGDRPAALVQLGQVLAAPQIEKCVRSFIDEGQGAVDLLSAFAQQQGNQGPAATILAACTGPVPVHPKRVEGLTEPLSPRELEVLQLLSTGASNQEIAGRCYITINTLKKHLTSVYGKLSVASRMQAVERARALRLIDDLK